MMTDLVELAPNGTPFDPASSDRADAASDWFALQVWAGREVLSTRHLETRGYKVFLPRYPEYRRWSDRVKKVERPFFPGYVFSRVGPEAAGTIISTPGVIRIVTDGRRPLPVAREEIEAIRRVVEARLTAEPWQYFAAGQRVRLVAGPLHDVEGVVLRINNRHRLILSVSLLQRSVAVEVDPQWVTGPA
jgi:transcription antitermination factor NusG